MNFSLEKMDQRVLFLVCGVLATAISIATCIKLNKTAYLNLPLQGSMKPNDSKLYSSSFYDKMREALLKIRVTNGSDADAVLRGISTAEKSNEVECDVYEELTGLASETVKCTATLTGYVLDIIALNRDHPDDSLKPFVIFLEEFGRRKFGKCTEDDKTKEEMAQINTGEKKLDQFFSIVFRQKGDIQLNSLRMFNLATSYFNIRKVVTWLRTFEERKNDYTKTPSIDIFINYIHGACNDFQRGRKNALDIFSLAYVFGSHINYTNRNQKLIEYYRVCMSWRKDRSQETLARIKKLLIEDQWIKKCTC